MESSASHSSLPVPVSVLFDLCPGMDPPDSMEQLLRSKYEQFSKAWRLPLSIEHRADVLCRVLEEELVDNYPPPIASVASLTNNKQSEFFDVVVDGSVAHKLVVADSSLSISQAGHTDLSQAFVYALLKESDAPIMEAEFEAALRLIPRSTIQNGQPPGSPWLVFTNHLKYFSFTGYKLLKATPVKHNLIWLIDQLIQVDATGAEGLLIGLLRYQDQDAISLIKKHMTGWVSQHPSIVPYALLAMLASRDTLTAQQLFSTFQNSALDIGRDLILWLQQAGPAELPSLKPIWRALLEVAPDVLASDGDSNLLVTLLTGKPTHRRFANALLLPELETWLSYLQEQVPLLERTQYMTWLQDKFDYHHDLSIVRFLNLAYHPSNAQLASGTVARWAIYLDLLLTRPSDDLLLAILFDWLFFDLARGDSIMLIEPAILLLYNLCTLKTKSKNSSFIQLAGGIVAFLEDTCTNFYKPLETHCRGCLRDGLKTALDKRVIPSLNPILKTLQSESNRQFLESLLDSGTGPTKRIDEKPALVMEKKMATSKKHVMLEEKNSPKGSLSFQSLYGQGKLQPIQLLNSSHFSNIENIWRAIRLDLILYNKLPDPQLLKQLEQKFGQTDDWFEFESIRKHLFNIKNKNDPSLLPLVDDSWLYGD